MGIGMLAVVAAAVLMGVMPSMQKQVILDGLPMMSMFFFTGAVSSVGSFFVGKATKQSFRTSRPQLLQALTMGLLGMVIPGVLLNIAYQFMPVGACTMILFLYPSLVCIIMATIFRAGMSGRKIAAVVCSVVGMVALTGGSTDLPLKGVLLSLMASVAYAIYMIGNEKGAVNDLPLAVKMFYYSLPGTLLFTVLAPLTGALRFPSSPTSWLQLLVCCGLFSLLGYFLMAFGIGKLGAATASFLSMLEPVVSVVFSVLWFHDSLSWGAVIGSCLIFFGMVLITTDDNSRKRGSS